jgi:hypothetical protein
MDIAADLLADVRGQKFATILADPPWQFQNKTGKVAPEHRRLTRCGTPTLVETAGIARSPTSRPRPPISIL